MGNSGDSQLLLAGVGLSCKLEKGSPTSSAWDSAHTRTPLLSGVRATLQPSLPPQARHLCAVHILHNCLWQPCWT